MIKHALYVIALITMPISGSLGAQQPATAPQTQTIEQPDVTVPGALLSAIVGWLASNFDLPKIYDHPRIERVPAATIATLRYKGLLSARELPGQRDVVAVYVDDVRTIYLAEDWTGGTPTELSVLVHEMVHHLQNLAGEKYECREAREKVAYAAQNRWLGLFRHDLSMDFGLDPFSLLVKTRCGY